MIPAGIKIKNPVMRSSALEYCTYCTFSDGTRSALCTECCDFANTVHAYCIS